MKSAVPSYERLAVLFSHRGLLSELGCSWNGDHTASTPHDGTAEPLRVSPPEAVVYHWNYGPDLEIGASLSPGLRLSLSPDGKALAAAQVVSTSDLWVLEGFQPPRSLWQRLRPW